MSAERIEFEHDALVQQLGLHLQDSANLDYCRFSESSLWPLQRQYYQRQGVNAARSRQLGSDNIETPMLADTYAGLVLAYWEDALCSGQLDPEQRVCILEAGCGGGAFTFLLLQSLSAKISRSALADLHWTLVASDMVQSNLDYLRSHPQLACWLAESRLDTLCLDLEAPCADSRSHGGLRLDELANPLVVINNRIFSSLTQDLLQIHYGSIFEARVATARSDAARDAELAAAATSSAFVRKQQQLENPFAGIELHYNWIKQENPDWLPQESRSLLSAYVDRLDSSSLLIPSGALSCLCHLLQASKRRCLVLGLDYGHCTEQDLRAQQPPQLYTHGDFSLPLNYHLLQRHVQSQGGLSWLSPQSSQNGLLVSALLFADELAAFGNTQTCILKTFADFSVDDYLKLRTNLPQFAANLSAEAMLSLIKLSHYDFNLLLALLPHLPAALRNLASHEREQWCQALSCTWQRHLCNGADSNELFGLGLLALDLNHWPCAAEIFTLLRERHPDDADTAFNLALVLLHTGPSGAAREQLEAFAGCKDANPDDGEGEQADASEGKPRLLQSIRAFEQQCSRLSWFDASAAQHDALVLRPLSWFDAPALCYQYRDPAIAVLTRLPHLETVADAEAWIAQESAEPDKAIFSVLHRDFGFVGMVSFRYAGNKGYFWFWIGTDYQNAGLGQQAALLAQRQAAAFGIDTFYTSVYRDNRRSIHALEKCNFERLPFQAQEPDEELFFYRHLASIENTVQQAGPLSAAAEIHQELSDFLAVIDSPIKLK